ncbi:MAG: PP2C family protein-serine/threonine phosphatase [Thermonemataceae bacterium]
MKNQYVQLFQQLITQYERTILQFILCDEKGDVLLSSNNFIKLSAQNNLFKVFEPLAGLQESVAQLQKTPLQIPRVEVAIPSMQGIYDFKIIKHIHQKEVLLFVCILDNTAHNHYLQTVQQERNEAVISKELTDLKLQNETLKEEVAQRTKEILQQKNHLERQKKRIDASLKYAKGIQESLLPDDTLLYNDFFDAFVLYQPKEVVSGDFYWIYPTQDVYYIVVADCTGHGVPAAMLSIVGNLYLSEIIKRNIQDPAMILTQLDQRVRKLFSNIHSQVQIKDGMDLTLVKIDTAQRTFTLASARREVVYLNREELFVLEGSRRSVNGQFSHKKGDFINQTLLYEPDDLLYLFTDGYADQFGGKANRKFMKGSFRQLLQKVAHLPLHQQKYNLLKTLDDWKQEKEQTDDILIMGIHFK